MPRRRNRTPLAQISPLEEATFRRAYEPYAAEMGHANIAWNRLQENLGNLFGVLLGSKHKEVAASIWYATTNDRLVRDILAAVAQTKLRRRKELLEDVEWLLARTDAIAEDRNNVIHSPLILARLLGPSLFALPDYFSGHKRAKKLKNKDLIDEYKELGERATKLCEFANALVQHIHKSSLPCPERPGGPLFPTKKKTKTKPLKALNVTRRFTPRPPSPLPNPPAP